MMFGRLHLDVIPGRLKDVEKFLCLRRAAGVPGTL